MITDVKCKTSIAESACLESLEGYSTRWMYSTRTEYGVLRTVFTLLSGKKRELYIDCTPRQLLYKLIWTPFSKYSFGLLGIFILSYLFLSFTFPRFALR